MKKLFLLLLVFALIAGGVILVKKKRQELANLPTPTLPPLVVRVVSPSKRFVEQTKSYLATYHTLQKALLATKFAGTIEKLFVDEGTSVKKGEILAILDDSELKAAIKNAEAKVAAIQTVIASTEALLKADSASLNVAHDAYKRAKKLYAAEAISKESLQKAQAAYLAAKAKLTATNNLLFAKRSELKAALANLTAKQKELSYTKIKAPFDGVVEHLFFKEGSFAPIGKPIVSLLGSQKVFDILFDRGLRPHMKIKDYPCTIDTILPYTQNSLNIARSYCKAKLNEGEEVTLEIVQKALKGAAIPLSALYEQNNQTYVFVYKDGAFHPQKVTILVMGKEYCIPSPTINHPVATGTHSELGKLFFTKNVKVVREQLH